MNSEAADGATTLNKAPTDTPSEAAPNELPLPSDPKTVFLGGLFILALLGAASSLKLSVLRDTTCVRVRTSRLDFTKQFGDLYKKEPTDKAGLEF